MDLQEIKEDIVELKGAVKETHTAVMDLRVLVAGQYATKTEVKTEIEAVESGLEEHKKEERSERWKMLGATLGICTLVFSAIQLAVSLL